MFDRLKSIFSKKSIPRLSDKQYEQDYELKLQGLEKVLGKMYDLVGHSIIPYQVGGMVDMYYFPSAIDGTAVATMELLEPDGSGPLPSRIGTYELVAFTKFKIGNENDKLAFEQVMGRVNLIFTVLSRYSREANLNPLETVEVPVGDGELNRCLILDEYKKPGMDFMVGGRKHGLLLVIEVFRSEMVYAMEHGSQIVLEELKKKGYYPYSDLDREPVF